MAFLRQNSNEPPSKDAKLAERIPTAIDIQAQTRTTQSEHDVRLTVLAYTAAIAKANAAWSPQDIAECLRVMHAYLSPQGAPRYDRPKIDKSASDSAKGDRSSG